MAIWYIKKWDKKLGLLKKLFKPIDITQIENKYIVELPDEKYVSKFARQIYEQSNQNLVIASDLNKEQFTKIANVLDGRWIFKYLIPDVLEYITTKAKVETQKQEIVIMTNDNSENNCKLLVEIAKKVKMLSIVTNDIDKFKRLEEYLLQNLGIVIRTTNNRKKALIKSSIIFNIDFGEDALNQYSIPKNVVIINIKDKISIKSKRFEGINCSYYNIVLPEEYENWFKEHNLKDRFDKFMNKISEFYLELTEAGIPAEGKRQCSACSFCHFKGEVLGRSGFPAIDAHR